MNSKNANILQEIVLRRSIFSFSDLPIEPEKLDLLFEAARRAPSSLNLQPWRFIYAHRSDDDNYNRIFNLLNDGNRRWAGSAPVLAVSITEIVMEYKSRNNRFAFFDLGMAMGNFLVQATYLGLYVHQMGGFDIEKARKMLQIPEKYEPVTVIAIGYKGDVEKLPDDLKSRETATRSRKETKEFVYKGSWGKNYLM